MLKRRIKALFIIGMLRNSAQITHRKIGKSQIFMKIRVHLRDCVTQWFNSAVQFYNNIRIIIQNERFSCNKMFRNSETIVITNSWVWAWVDFAQMLSKSNLKTESSILWHFMIKEKLSSWMNQEVSVEIWLQLEWYWYVNRAWERDKRILRYWNIR